MKKQFMVAQLLSTYQEAFGALIKDDYNFTIFKERVFDSDEEAIKYTEERINENTDLELIIIPIYSSKK